MTEKRTGLDMLIGELRAYSKQHNEQIGKLTGRVQENAEQIKSHNGKLDVITKILYVVLSAWIVAIIAQIVQVIFR